ncbi:DUF5689 domain-containing protein [Sphingobacterium sp. lm-10]|uniref:DUF5689 domain-containing protein n=1 Tax=Sphingobacterium sp. lm-10 TaxID=2944904 RepID=UPI0020213AD2|nr:DUF5689 domain-containing protein [Sphingobacterium sp. lm-10]MCL7986614.1 DUF5689 domain-containing protein [Sphingobacterium sp. lm-10]
MKKLSYSILFIALGLITVFTACENRDHILGTLSPYITIQDLRAVHKGNDVEVTVESVNEAQWTTGVVISDVQSGNVPEGMLIVQQLQRGNKLHGIALKVGDGVTDYRIGDSLRINISGKTLRRETFLYLDGLRTGDLEVVAHVPTVAIRQVSASAINQRPHEYEGTFVQIGGAEVVPTPVGGDSFVGAKKIINGADTLVIRTLPTANYATLPVPRNLNVKGILLGDADGLMAVWPFSEAHIEDTSDPVIPGDLGDMPLIFTGYCPDPEGGDGNYEYIQLMANADINFAEIPFAVVTTNNAGANQPNAGAAPGAGWSTGGARTLKFNLTEGSVKKGEFFYVGGHQKRISGANSTTLAELNWVRAIPYTSSGGDGLGDANANILANSGNASGMALFVGTNINEASVPLDVVMFGGLGTATVIDSVANLGYRIPNNDHYNRFHPETLAPQPFFSMGSNQYRVPHFVPANVGFFIKLGGVFNATTRTWEVARSYYPQPLSKQAPASVLSTGTGVTQQVD